MAIEVLSPSSADRDLRWKLRTCRVVDLLRRHCQDAVDVVVYTRASNFAEQRLESLGVTLDLPALEISLPLAEVYQDVERS